VGEEERSDMRLQCLHIASRSLGECYDYGIVLVAAQDFYEWVAGNGKKAELHLVWSQEDDGA
jgi:hypothetical protein